MGPRASMAVALLAIGGRANIFYVPIQGPQPLEDSAYTVYKDHGLHEPGKAENQALLNDRRCPAVSLTVPSPNRVRLQLLGHEVTM